MSVRRLCNSDRGSASVELAILAPAVISAFVMVMMAGQINMTRQAVEAAAFDAARTASISRAADDAQRNGEAAAASRLAQQGIVCQPSPSAVVVVDTREFALPAGQSAQVTATVTCTISFSDIALAGMPGSYTFTANFVSPIDTYRRRE